MGTQSPATTWDSLTKIIPESEKDVHELLATLKQTNTSVITVRESLMSVFDYLADTVKPKPIWAEKAWAFLDQTTQGDK